ncbi:unnamed protein product [Amoebophrya sp. A120]|nr:unnamed protein product [Amoebophrya sp. A120]|eukprot:GSA120T00018023001.1
MPSWLLGAACVKCKQGLHFNNDRQLSKMLEVCGHLYHVQCYAALLEESDERNPAVCCECKVPLVELGDLIEVRTCFKRARTTANEFRTKKLEEIQSIHARKQNAEEQIKMDRKEAKSLSERATNLKQKRLALAEQTLATKQSHVLRLQKKKQESEEIEHQGRQLLNIFTFYKKSCDEEQAKMPLPGSSSAGDGDDNPMRTFFNWNYFNDSLAQGLCEVRGLRRYEERQWGKMQVDLNRITDEVQQSETKLENLQRRKHDLEQAAQRKRRELEDEKSGLESLKKQRGFGAQKQKFTQATKAGGTVGVNSRRSAGVAPSDEGSFPTSTAFARGSSRRRGLRARARGQAGGWAYCPKDRW